MTGGASRVSRYGSGRWWALALGVALVAFLARLLPVLNSGGLHAINQYDAGVYFGSAVGLVHGRLPYRDFLLLHPPGVVLALTPFAALTWVIGDASAMAVARLAWMGLGAVNAVLVARILRPLGLLPALLGGLCYALFYPAVVIEQTTRLEAIPATCLLGAFALLGRTSSGARPSGRATVLAGVLLGVSSSIKIWGVIPLVVIAAVVLMTAGIRRAGLLAVGAGVAGVAICVPFLLAAPSQMWRYVVIDQLDRQQSRTTSVQRLADMTGIGLVENRLGDGATPLVIAATVGVGLLAALAGTVLRARLALVLLAALALTLLTTPSWFPHYAGVLGAPLAVVFGAATYRLLAWARQRRLWRAGVVGLLSLVLVGFAVQLTEAEFGDRFPRKRMAAAVRGTPGCITADDPSVLIAMNVLSRNLRRGCPLSLDLGGYSYDLRPPGPWPVARERNQLWQRHALDYLSSGTVTIVVRYTTRFGLAPSTAATIRRWPVVYRVGRYKLQRPTR